MNLQDTETAVATPGAVLFNFSKKGIIRILKSNLSEDDLFMGVSEAGAEDFVVEEDGYMIVTPPDLLYQVRERLDLMGASVEEANLEMIPKTYVECSEEVMHANEALIEWLEALDDVDAVSHNMKI